MSSIIKRLLAMPQPLLWKLYRMYMSRKRWYKYGDLRISIRPTVFHPALFFSTQYQLDYWMQKSLDNSNFLELGAGSGLIAMSAYKAGARVTASDINPNAIEALQETVAYNKLEVAIIESDLFDNIPLQQFDYISVNPPYYQGTPANWWEKAFYCGPQFEYFHQLFAQVGAYMHSNTCMVMILSIDCAIEHIASIAKQHSFDWKKMDSRKIWGEWNYIFEIRKQVIVQNVNKVSETRKENSERV